MKDFQTDNLQLNKIISSSIFFLFKEKGIAQWKKHTKKHLVERISVFRKTIHMHIYAYIIKPFY